MQLHTSRFAPVAALCLLTAAIPIAPAQTGTALVRHAAIVDGTLDGSLHQMTPEPLKLDGNAVITGNLLVPGTPTVRLSGKPVYAGVSDGAGASVPSDYTITLGGTAALARIIQRTDPVTLPGVAAPTAPTGTRRVVLKKAGDDPGAFATLRDLRLDGTIGQVIIPAGAYGEFAAAAGNGFTLGQAGATEPAVYHFQKLVLHARAEIRVVGPVVINVATGLVVDGNMGSAATPGWLQLNTAVGVTVSGNGAVNGFVHAPAGLVTIAGGAEIIGGLTADRLEIKGGGLLRLTNRPPVPIAPSTPLVVAEDGAAAIVLAATDPDGDVVTFKVVTRPSHGALTGTPPRLNYVPATNYAGQDSFTFNATDGRVESPVATIAITVTPENDRPIADSKRLEVSEDKPSVVTLSGTDVDGDALRFEIVTPPAHGALTGEGGARTYTPASDFNGSDLFTYVVTDGTLRSEAATVSITVSAVNDAPVAVAQSVSAIAGTATPVSLRATDVDGDALTYTIVSAPLRGTLSGAAPEVFYTASAEFSGTDTFTFAVSDSQGGSANGVVTIAVAAPPNRRPQISSSAPVSMELHEEFGGAGVLRGTIRDFSKTHPNFEENLGNQSSAFIVTGLVAPYLGGDRKPVPQNLGQAGSSTDTVENFRQWFRDVPGVNYSREIELPIAETVPGAGTYSYRSDAFFPIDNEFFGHEDLSNGQSLHYFLFTCEYHTRFVYQPGQTVTFGGDDAVWVFVDDRLVIDLGGVHGSVEVTASLDSLGLVAGRAYAMDIYHAEQHTGNSSFRLRTSMAFEVAETYRYAVQASDPDGDTLTFALTQAPSGMKIDPQSGIITWTTDRTGFGSHPIVVEVRDARGLMDTQSYTLNVFANSPPTIAWESRYYAGRVGAPVFLSATVKDDGYPANQPVVLNWEKLSGPGAVTFAQPTAASTAATFSAAGLYVLQLRATDGSREAMSTVEVRIDLASAVATAREATSWWPGNDTAEDVIGVRNGEALFGANYSPGVVGSAFTFDGVNDIVRVRANPDLDIGTATQGFALQFWMRCEIDTPMGAVLGWRSATGATGPVVNLDNYLGARRLSFELRRADGTNVGVGGEQLWALNQWVHLAFTYDRNTGLARIYRDGALKVEKVVGALALQTATDLWWGCLTGFNGNFFRGRLDEIVLHRRPLSSPDVYSSFASGSAGNLPPSGNQPPTANAGPDIALRSPDQPLLLTGTVSDDGRPAGGVLRTQWSFVSGPAVPTIAAPASLSTTATLPAAGTYVFKLAASDGEAATEDLVQVKAGQLVAARPPGLVAWWTGNDTAMELMRGMDGDWNNAPAYVTGAVSSAFNFDGQRAVTVPASPDLNAGAWDGFSLEFWLRPTAPGPGTATFLGWKGLPETRGVTLYLWNFITWQLGVDLVDKSGKTHSISYDGLSFNQWQHLVLTYDRRTGVGRIYRDGAQVRQSSLGSLELQTGFDFHWGNFSNSGFRGSIDEISLYNRAIGSEEAYALFSASSAGKEPRGANSVPLLSAGPDRIAASIADVVTLTGTVSDDGLPATNGLQTRWTQLSGPGTVTFDTPTAAATAARFDRPGTYVLQLEADDGLTRASDLTEVRIGPFQTADASSDLVAWWPGNHSPREMVSGLDAQWVGPANYSDAGAVASALWFTGSQYLRVPASSGLDACTWPGLSIEFWIRPNGLPQSGPGSPLLEWRHPTEQVGVSIVMTYSGGAHMAINLTDTAGQAHSFRADSVFVDAVWQHIVITYDRATGRARAFRNGRVVMEVNLGSFVPQTNYELLVGKPGTVGFFGGLDEIAVHRRALAAAEVAATYAAGEWGRARSNENAAPVVDAGPDVMLPKSSAVAPLNAVVTDDGRPFGPASLTWSVIGAPDGAVVTFADPTRAVTTVTANVPGTYLLRLTADDHYAAPISDTVELRLAPGAADSPSDLAAWWPANASPVDRVGGHFAELLNGAKYSDGRVLQGFAFDGSGSVVRVDGHADLDIGASPNGMAIEFWARWDSTVSLPLFAWMDESGSADYVRAATASNGRSIDVWIRGTDGQDRTLAGPPTLSPGQFVHVAITYDRTTGMGKLYYNGLPVIERALGVFTPDTRPSRRLWIGSRHDMRKYKGVIDEFTLYRRALTPTEIGAIVLAAQNGKTPPDDNAPPVVDAGPDIAVANTIVPVSLTGSALDDGKPFGAPSIEWRLIAGPGNVTFENANSAATTAQFDVAGTYLLELTASDGLLGSVSDQVEVRVGVALAEPPAEMSSWWPANLHTREVVMGNAPMVLRNGATYAAGRVLQGFSFDGVDDHAWARVHSDTDLGASAAGFTVEFWLKPPETRDGAIVSWGDNGVSGLAIYQYTSGREIDVNFRERSSGTDRGLRTTGIALTAGQWAHVAVTHDRSTGEMRIYINGVVRASSFLGTAAVRTQYPLVFGRNAWDTGMPWRGALDEPALYKRPLSSDEIWALYAAADGKSPADNNTPPKVDAGPDIALVGTTATARLTGRVTDDNLPFGAPVVNWTVVAGPGSVAFENPASSATTAMFSEPGTYLLELKGSDGYTAPASDRVEVRVGVATAETPAGISAWWPATQHGVEMVNARAPVELMFGASYGAGKVLHGWAFDGVDDFGRVAAHGDIDVGTSAAGFSIEFWMKPAEYRDGMILSWGAGGTAGLAVYQYGSGRELEVNYRDRSSGTDRGLRTTGNALTAGEWTHVVVTQDRPSGELRIFVNGALRASGGGMTSAVRTQHPLVVGRNAWDTSFAWKGTLDELALYQRPLGAVEVQRLFASGSDGKSLLAFNEPPRVSAGGDIVLPQVTSTAALNGIVMDDRRPFGAPDVRWSVVDAPGSVTFGDVTSAATTATFGSAGTYVLKLTATDRFVLPVSDIVEVRVGVPSVAARPDVAAWWPGNGHPDEIVHGNRALELFNGTGYTAGRVAQSFVFDGIDDEARALPHPDFHVGASPLGFTLEFWVRPDRVGQGEFPLVTWHNGVAQGMLVRATSTGTQPSLFLRFEEGGGNDIHPGALFTGRQGQWVHLAYTYDRPTGTVCVYRDGVLASQQTATANRTVCTNYQMRLGRWPEAGSFKGALDEITLYRRPLTGTEIAAIYGAANAGKTPPAMNHAPLGFAGVDTSGFTNAAVMLMGNAGDDGLPNPPGVLSYQWSRMGGPGGVVFSSPNSLGTTATFDTPGRHTMRLTVSDSVLSASDDVDVTITAAASQPPTVAMVQPQNGMSVPANVAVQLTASAADADGSISKLEFLRDGVLLGIGSPVEGQPGLFSITTTFSSSTTPVWLSARATDNSGVCTTSLPVNVRLVTDDQPPFVEITTPEEDARISAPLAIKGVAAGPLLSSWALEHRLKAADGAVPELWTRFSSGTASVGSAPGDGAPLVAETLGTFDPTRLLNGIHEIRLVGEDTAGRINVAGPITVLVEGNMKVGAFTLAFEDLKVPLPGVPITVTRTYDSRDSRIGDFGPGWRLALNNIRVQKNRHLGRGWWQTAQQGSGLQFYYVEPIVDRIVAVVMPDGETHRFRAGAFVKNREGDPDNASFAVTVRQGKFRFYPLGDTTSKLEPLNAANELAEQFYIGGTGTQDLTFDEFGETVFNTTRYRLTAADGTTFILDETLGLLEMRDTNGNSLVLNRDPQMRVNAVTSTQVAAEGAVVRQVTIVRDASGRIDYIRDPAGKDLDYLYDAQGRLASFVNRESNVTQFRYELSDASSHPQFHYLTRVIDPRGVTALRSEFDSQTGRLLKQIDADGKETVFNGGVDATGRFEKVKDRHGNETTFYYDERGNVTLKVDPLGAQTKYEYWPGSDRVKMETDHYGNAKSMAYDERGNVTVETIGAVATDDPANPTTGYTTRTTYNAVGVPTRVTDPDGRMQTFTYDPATNDLLTHTLGASGADPSAGDRTTYTYNRDGTVATITDALGNVTTHTYENAFSTATFPSAVKQVTVTLTDPAGSPGSDVNNPTAIVLRTVRTLYDAQENQVGQVARRTLPDGRPEDVVTRYVYDAENRLRATIQPDGRVSETRYTAFGKDEKTIAWKSVADFEAQTLVSARVTTFGYDSRGNQTSVTHADGTTERTGFDPENRKTWSQDRRGYRTFFIYDALGRLRFTIHPDATDGLGDAAPVSAADSRLSDNPRTETQYDLIGRVRFQIDERGAKTEYTYDDNCGCSARRKQMIQHSASGNLVTGYGYDRAGNVRFVTDPRGNTVETRYDDRGLATTVIYPATDEHPATRTETSYDALGRRVAVTDQEEKITRYRYDAAGRLVEVRQYLEQAAASADASFSLGVSDPRVVSTRYAYGELGSQTAQIDSLGRVTRYESDAAGRRTKRILPEDGNPSGPPAFVETLQYDGWGNLWKRTDFAGKTTTFAYDTQNRLVSKTADPTHPSLGYTHATARVEFDYDQNGARTAARTFNSANTQLYAETTPRDERGRVDYKDAGPAGRLDYSYQANGLLKDVVSSNADGVNIGYRYDDLNRLSHVDDASTGVPPRTTTYAYNGNGSLKTLTQPNGIVHSYTYDALNRLRTLHLRVGAAMPNGPPVGTLHHTYEYKLRPTGHRRQVLETLASAPATLSAPRTTDYDYDALYRLTGETVANDPNGNTGSIGYSLDKVGNRGARTSTIGTVPSQTNLTYNARDWLNGDTYNANGSTVVGQIADTALQGTDGYDFEERLIVRTRADGTSINISYDADGHRFAKNVLGPTGAPVSSTSWLIDTNNLTGYAQVFEERVSTAGTGTSPSTARFVVYAYGSDLISQTSMVAGQSAVVNYFAYDGHGSTRELTDAAGRLTDRYDYDAFGNLMFKYGVTDNCYRHCGEQSDGELGLYYLRARYLNPDSSRFTSMDPFEGRRYEPVTLHKYVYANANPVIYLDSSGYLSLFDYAVIGRWVHLYIGRDFTIGHLNRRSDVSISAIMQDFVDDHVDIAIRPDLVDLDVSEAYEIKPNKTGRGAERAKKQLKRYIDTFASLGLELVPGSNYNPPSEIPAPPLYPKMIITVERSEPGVIIYTIDEKRDGETVKHVAQAAAATYSLAQLQRLVSKAIAAQNAAVKGRISQAAVTRGVY